MIQQLGRDHAVYAKFARILEYPWAGSDMDIRDFADDLSASYPDASKNLRKFLDVIATMSLEEVKESYTRAFDMAPQCIPYLSVYLFGEESYKRSELMTGLLGAYEKAEYLPGNELPDHLIVVLGFAPCCSSEEWDELVHWCLPGPLPEMVRSLERAHNPYAHILRALQCVFRTHYPQEFRHV